MKNYNLPENAFSALSVVAVLTIQLPPSGLLKLFSGRLHNNNPFFHLSKRSIIIGFIRGFIIIFILSLLLYFNYHHRQKSGTPSLGKSVNKPINKSVNKPVNNSTDYTKSDPIGTINGTFSVNGNGAANYIIPIEVPPGTNQVQPDLSVVYDSQKGNGYMGMGFFLNGISSITRCSATYAQDDYRGGVYFNDKDRLCIDGARLVNVEGEYWADGTVYHTEKQTWTKIIGHKCGKSHYCYFTAQNSV